MIEKENVLVVDIDGTLCYTKTSSQEYKDVLPRVDMINKLREDSDKGFYIILLTSRQMRTYDGNIGKINANTAKVLFDWLEKYQVPYDEIHFGKPWCGKNGFYIDDKTVRPDEFLSMEYEEILKKLEK